MNDSDLMKNKGPTMTDPKNHWLGEENWLPPLRYFIAPIYVSDAAYYVPMYFSCLSESWSLIVCGIMAL